MVDKLNRFKELLAEVFDLNAAAALLGWDEQTYMPKGGAEERGEALATLSRLAHIRFTSDEVGALIDDLKPMVAQLDPDSDDARLVRVVERQYRKLVKVPERWVSEFARATSVAHHAWIEARGRKDFKHFQPYLEKNVELRREYASFFAPYQHVYDPLLDDHEPGLTTAEVQAIFDQLRPQQVALIREIAARPPVDDSFLRKPYPEQPQWDFGVEVITRFGFDWNRGRQDKSAHPFTTSFGLGDVRITTRFEEHLGTAALLSTMHEGGHALYDQGYAPSLRRTPLASGASYAVHESQSRLWENLVGRSHEFWEHFYPRFQAIFSTYLGNVSLEQFYRAINKVEPSLIRVNADEATYNLHIMLRMELEIALMEGSLSVADLPEAWNERMRDYLGLTPPDVALGVLQDVHWSGGSIGYFPTYALGNLISVQLWEKAQADIPDLRDQIRQGRFDGLLGWLRENVHRHGAKFEPQELVERATGSKIDPQPYLRYLRNKFGQIYGLLA
jgi:carboxypeptidase Taq